MIAPRKGASTYADIEALRPGVTGELLLGALYARARPAGPHLAVASRLGTLVGGAFDRGVGGPGGWTILDAPELHFADDVLVPDLAGWRKVRMPKVRSAPFITLAPDWICEVPSPGTMRVDRVLKLPIYAREGVAFAWLVDPIERSIEVFQLENGRWVLLRAVGEGEPAPLEPFDAVPLDLAYLWS